MTQPATVTRSPLRLVAAGLGLVAAIVAVYAFSLRGDFLWDDDLHITANPTIIGPLGLKEIWTSARANYFPLVLSNFWVQHALWGVDPVGYRVVTLAFHVAAALVLWLVLRRLYVPGAWLGAALWALHPVQVESVAWICELKNTQSAVFFLLAIYAFIRFVDDEGYRPYVLALLCAVLALLSKPSTVMLPVALGLVTWWIRGRFEGKDVLRLAPFFALSGLAAGWTIWEQKYHSGAIGAEWSQSLPERVAIAGRAIWFYLGKLIWPEPLMFIYPRWQINVAQPQAFLPMFVIIAGFFALWRGRRDRLRPALVLAIYFVALLFPVLGFFSVYFFRYSFVGDHFQYLASMGPLAFGGAVIAGLRGRMPLYVGAIVLGVLGFVTARQARVYLSNETLWRDTVAHNPGAVMAWLNLADTLARAERYDEAMVTYRRALQIRPTDPDAWNDLGNLLALVGQPTEAVTHFEKALTLKPDFADAHSNLGNVLRTLGRSDDAVAHYRRALALVPRHAGALNNLGAELAEKGQPDEAVRLFDQALQERPKDAATLDNRAGAWRALGRLDEALKDHEAAVRLKPEFALAHANYARTLAAAGRGPEALVQFERALELKPTFAAVRGQYATALLSLGRQADALVQLEKAVVLSPDSPEAQLNLGAALAETGKAEVAIERFENALRLAPDFAAAHTNLGLALIGLRRWGPAIVHLQAAVKLQPTVAATRAQLAFALVNDDQLTAAVPQFEAALQLNPQVAEVHENFGQVLNALGRKREAFDHLEEAARLRRVGGR